MTESITAGSKKSAGIKIPEASYDRIREFILSELLTSNETTLTDLLRKADSSLGATVGKELNWFLVQVKMDLQARNLIRISFGPGYVQWIRIKPDARKKVKVLLNIL